MDVGLKILVKTKGLVILEKYYRQLKNQNKSRQVVQKRFGC